jgi:enoyl-CoA hydratase
MTADTRVHAHLRLSVPEPGVAVVSFERPASGNTLDASTAQAFLELLDELGSRDGLRALVIRGTDKAFCSGSDLEELAARGRDDALESRTARICERIEAFPRPVIAAVSGLAIASGCEIALACDMRVAGRSARFGFPEVTLGVVPAAGGTYRLWRTVGMGVAKELILTGRLVTAEEAATMGLVNRVVDDAQVLDVALEYAATLVENAPLAVRLAKTLLNAAPGLAQPAAGLLASLAQATLYETGDKNTRVGQLVARRRGAR